jgi:hypothetical protein
VRYLPKRQWFLPNEEIEVWFQEKTMSEDIDMDLEDIEGVL